MWTVASTTAVITQLFSDTGTILTAVLATLMGAVVALLGIGFAYRHIKRYITGKKI